jgi:hypothetical protein
MRMMRSFHLQDRRGEESNKEKRQVNNKESATAGKGSKGREGGKLWPKQKGKRKFLTTWQQCATWKSTK